MGGGKGKENTLDKPKIVQRLCHAGLAELPQVVGVSGSVQRLQRLRQRQYHQVGRLVGAGPGLHCKTAVSGPVDPPSL